MAHLGLLALSWACFHGLARLSWGHWALLWAKFGVWRVAFGGWEDKNGDVVENQKTCGKTEEKQKKFRQILDRFAWQGGPRFGVVERLGAKVGYMGLSKF